MDNKLLLQDAVSKVAEIDYESDQVLIQQRIGAIAVKDLIARFNAEAEIDDYELLALVLVRFKDLQVRDYAMGLATDENKDELFNLWYWLMNLSPKGYIAPVACIFAACAYESGETELAHAALDKAFADDLTEQTMVQFIHTMSENGFSINGESFIGNMAFVIECVKATIYKEMDLEHPMANLMKTISKVVVNDDAIGIG